MDQTAYLQQLGWRSALSRAQHESERFCRSRGVTAPQYHVLLAVKACEAFTGPTVGRIAQLLCVVPSTAVGLVDRLVNQGFVERCVDRWDARVVRLTLTPAGEAMVEELATWHRERLRELGSALMTATSPAIVSPETIQDLVEPEDLARDDGADELTTLVDDR
jgi:DNA-binding MarR family transcriptional regulator